MTGSILYDGTGLPPAAIEPAEDEVPPELPVSPPLDEAKPPEPEPEPEPEPAPTLEEPATGEPETPPEAPEGTPDAPAAPEDPTAPETGTEDPGAATLAALGL